jgi:hypothetical protein
MALSGRQTAGDRRATRRGHAPPAERRRRRARKRHCRRHGAACAHESAPRAIRHAGLETPRTRRPLVQHTGDAARSVEPWRRSSGAASTQRSVAAAAAKSRRSDRRSSSSVLAREWSVLLRPAARITCRAVGVSPRPGRRCAANLIRRRLRSFRLSQRAASSTIESGSSRLRRWNQNPPSRAPVEFGSGDTDRRLLGQHLRERPA